MTATAEQTTDGSGAQAAPETRPPAGRPDPAAHATPRAPETSTPAPDGPASQAEAADGDAPAAASPGSEQDEVRRLRNEARNLRTRLKTFEDQQAEAEAAKLSERERLEKRTADAERAHAAALGEIRELRTQIAVADEARAQNVRSPQAAADLLRARSLLTYDDDGTPTNVKAALKQLLEREPYLAGDPSAPSSAPIPATPRPADAAALSATQRQQLDQEMLTRVRRAWG